MEIHGVRSRHSTIGFGGVGPAKVRAWHDRCAWNGREDGSRSSRRQKAHRSEVAAGDDRWRGFRTLE